MRRDKSKTNILQMSELGLIQMTRKRTRESIGQVLCEPCFYCEGEGYLKSKQTVCYEILRELERRRGTTSAETSRCWCTPRWPRGSTTMKGVPWRGWKSVSMLESW